MLQERKVFELPVIRESLPVAEETASYPVFPFVSVRSPRLALAPTGSRDVAYGSASNLATGLAAARTALADDALAQREQMQALAAKAAAEQADKRAQLLPRATELAQLGRWLREGQEGLSAEMLESRPKAVALPDAEVQLVWDVLFQQALLGAQAVPFPEPIAILKAQRFLEAAKAEGMTLEVAQRQTAAELFLPKSIFSLTPLPVLPPPVAEAVPSLAPRQERLATLQAAVQEIRQQHELQTELARTTPAPPPPALAGEAPPADASQAPGKPSPEQLADYEKAQTVWKEWANNQEKTTYLVVPEQLSGAAAEVLKSLKLPDKVRFEFVLEMLTRQVAALTTELSQLAPGPAPLLRVGGALWALDNTGGDTVQTALGSSTVVVDPYDEFFDLQNNPQLRNRIRPLGIADLNVVEQTLCCYKAGEVAHIENVMQGEYKERATRRLRRSETTLTQETERETTQERDTTTTDRYELQKETGRVLQEDQSSSLGVTAAAGWGPVSIGATANFATATSSQTTDRQTASYAKSVVDRSLQRVTERIKERRTTTLIDEFEENSKHGLDNRNGGKHVVGLYRWIDKVYTMQVVNYGRRLMFEFAVPEPGGVHLWAMAKAAAISGTTISPPRGNPRTAALPGIPGALTDFSALNDTNFAGWAAAYGATVEPSPAEFKSVTTSVDASRPNPTYNGNYIITTGRPSATLDVPAGYECQSATMVAQFRGGKCRRWLGAGY